MASGHAPAKRTPPPSLVALLQAVEGAKLMFELHNDATISGRLASVDEQMKCGGGGD